MKKAIMVGVCAVLVSLGCGCFVRSLYPFYTKESVTEAPAIVGTWLPAKKVGADDAKKMVETWRFAEESIETVDENGVASTLDVKYFKVKDCLMVDMTCRLEEEPQKGEGPNAWWSLHVLPVHTAWKVELVGDNLRLTPLDEDWIKDMLRKKGVGLAHLKIREDEDKDSAPVVLMTDRESILLTAPSAELAGFLATHIADTNAFSDDFVLSFRRVKEQEAAPATE